MMTKEFVLVWFSYLELDYTEQEKCREIIESTLLGEDYYIYGWRQVPINPSVLGRTADQSRPRDSSGNVQKK